MTNQKAIPFLFAALITVSIACGSTTTEEPGAAPTSPPVEGTQPPAQTSTPKPTATTPPPTPTRDPNLVSPGTYLVGSDIKPGLYRGNAGEGLTGSCYWARLKDLSGAFDSILANDNSEGQFYLQVGETDKALETGSELVFLPSMPEPASSFPESLKPGMYLVGIDIKPGTYKGQAGTDLGSSCYWQRLRNLSGDLYSILANDNATGQFYIEVSPSDMALETACELTLVGD